MRAGSLIFLVICVCTISRAQQYNLKNFSVKDGLAQSQVFDLTEDSRGFIWAGTRGGGLSKFDGKNFTTYSERDGLTGNYVNSIFEDSHGHMWIASTTGLSRFNGLQFESIIDKDSGIDVQCICIHNGQIHAGTNRGVFVMGDDSLGYADWMSEYPVENVYDMLSFGGKLYGCTDNGLFVKSDDETILIDETDGLKSNLCNTLEEINGLIWVGSYGEGISIVDPTDLSIDRSIRSPDVILDIAKTTTNEVWVATLEDGVVVYKDKKEIRKINRSTGLETNHVRSLTEDNWGNIWIGTSGGGMARFSGQEFSHFDKDNGLPGSQVYSLARDLKGRLCLGVSTQGLITVNSIDPPEFVVDSIITDTQVKCLFKDSNRRLWIGCEGKGLYLRTADTTRFFSELDGMGVRWIRDICEGKSGELYVATAGGGISQIKTTKDGSFSVNSTYAADGLSENRITSLAIDHLDRLWFGTFSHGIGVVLPDGTIINFDNYQNVSGNAIRSLVIDDNNFLWIGTSADGLSRIDLNADKLQIEPFKATSSEISNNIYFLQLDEEQNLWIGTEIGIFELILNESRDLIDLNFYDQDDGYEGIESCTNASFKDDNGTLWFGTIDGFSEKSTLEYSGTLSPPKIGIYNVNLFYKPLIQTPQRIYVDDWGIPKDSLILTYEQNHLSFDITGVHQLYPEGISYRWNLGGEDDEWSPYTDLRTATYSNLAPGEYRFTAEVCSPDGSCTKSQPIYIHILRPFWQKLWFLVTAASGLLLLLVLIFWMRIRAIRGKAKVKQERLRLERDVIELEQKALRLQMNPHFIFNTLNSIQGLIVKKDEKTARLYLSKFSRLMRLTLENSRESLITIEQEIQCLEYFLDLEKFTHDNCFEYNIEVPEDLKDELIPPLIIQPFAENAIVHGLIPKNGKGTIDIFVKDENDHFTISVTDDGVGRASAKKNKETQNDYHKSTGLQVTLERLQLTHPENKSDHIVFNDLTDNKGESKGTEVVITVGKYKEE